MSLGSSAQGLAFRRYIGGRVHRHRALVTVVWPPKPERRAVMIYARCRSDTCTRGFDARRVEAREGAGLEAKSVGAELRTPGVGCRTANGSSSTLLADGGRAGAECEEEDEERVDKEERDRDLRFRDGEVGATTSSASS